MKLSKYRLNYICNKVVTVIASILLVILIFEMVYVKEYVPSSTADKKKEIMKVDTFNKVKNPTKIYKPKNYPLLVWYNPSAIGNCLFQYASHFCLASISRHTPTVPENAVLLNIFDNITALRTNGSDWGKCPNKRKERGWGLYDNDLVKWVCSEVNQKQCIAPRNYLQSYKYFQSCYDNLKYQLHLKSKIKKVATDIMVGKLLQHSQKLTTIGVHLTTKNSLHKILLTWQRHHASNNANKKTLPENITYIGVHVRRRDISIMATHTYFYEAFQYYRKRFKDNLVFYVCSDDIEWCIAEIGNKSQDVIFVSEPAIGAEVDFGVLISCNHTVITGGTFSWWAGKLAGGTVVYFKGFATHHNKIASSFKSEDYYPSNWIAMG